MRLKVMSVFRYSLLVLGAAVLSLVVVSGVAEAKRTNDDLYVTVDIDSQTMEVYVDGRLRHRWPVSTGRDGFETPGGSYRPQRLERQWFSKQYDDAPMPHSVFFSGGYAIHGTYETRRLGQPAPHGCIRLSARNAATLFGLVEEKGARRTRIVIAD